MGLALWGLGLVFVVEGLVYALAPSLVEDLLDALRRLTLEQRRLMGLGAITLGLALLWAARAAGV
ncbi:DUF2065 family protein [Histidinibacterium aquaticum]|uniref:DUF2065 domain-containing protein n=1 Tax=Histidinibacterium aquaticum TaxID=2613962 RepID=A0A5J5GN74_9RHOB|nr:DUF2065 family protein [Histidinibacterium aquaticum]KAA9009826.1 DUF2065 domain-containing protein [Histidinibacterium aquaticum]